MSFFKKSSLVFNLQFTTSKLLAYLVVISGAIIGYLLASAEVVIVAFVIGASLSGVKSISDNMLKLKNVSGLKDSKVLESVAEDLVGGENKDDTNKENS
jgi:hypothetical protein